MDPAIAATIIGSSVIVVLAIISASWKIAIYIGRIDTRLVSLESKFSFFINRHEVARNYERQEYEMALNKAE